jgi:hypothetical protein
MGSLETGVGQSSTEADKENHGAILVPRSVAMATNLTSIVTLARVFSYMVFIPANLGTSNGAGGPTTHVELGKREVRGGNERGVGGGARRAGRRG